MTDTIRTRLDALSEAQNASVVDAMRFATACARAYNARDLIPRDEVEGLIEAVVSAAEAVDIDTQLDYGNGDDLSTWLVQRDNLDALRVAKNAAADYLASIQTEEEK